ncbi:3'(2'),5'-bisphosphate nucleotidase CysQ [Kribbella antibiotica]|uniref:3'(2'),5'-bisphosphate nucleotidase CysQ n=1 Tax=Kribbella antibiotica TaxID=190195 RepID=A0A4R4ZNH2_9ACTN|nr:inositol monophosphatase family protein [Kribbella antibiotica]TDD58432.1 3'(2'),5'-bisphosphate nucleotidase CysQ [Kribbella antibiotica]
MNLIENITEIVQSAGPLLLERFSADARPADGDAIVKAIYANDDAVLALIKEPLLAARPGSGWVEDELEGGALPLGEWWIVDPVEGNINHIHGMTEWSVTATLVRDNEPVLTVVHLPLTGETYSAVAGEGAYLNGERLTVSAKTDLGAALVGTGQARPGESVETFQKIGRSVTAMLTGALIVQTSVPATLRLIQVAAGRMEAFWQHSDVRSGLVAGALLVREAGGLVTDLAGKPWDVTSSDFLASAPGVQQAALDVLAAA